MQLSSPSLLRSEIYRVFKKGDILRSYYFENIIDSNACSKEGAAITWPRKDREVSNKQSMGGGRVKKTVEVLSIPDKGSKGN